MLKEADISDVKEIIRFCSEFPLGSRTSGKLLTYGLDYDFFKVWLCRNEGGITAVLSAFENSLTVCANESADFEEIKSFLSFCGCSGGCAEKSTFDRLGIALKETKQMYRYTSLSGNTHFDIADGGDLKQVYKLISSAIPGSFPKGKDAYLSFLSDFTFRQRRGKARVKTFTENGTVLSCALTASESDTDAIISGVACDERLRGKGMGKKTVQALADELLKENKKVYVIALNNSAQAFYEKIGFNKESEICFF